MKKTNNETLVSIIITNFNKSKFLLEAVKSCLRQSYKKKEIIFFDDKSTDDSLKKIKHYKKKNKLDLKILSNLKKEKNSGPINQIIAIKKSINLAKGKFIFLLDSDDFFHKDKISGIIDCFKKHRKNKMILDQPIYKYKSKDIKKNFYNIRHKNKWPKFPPTSCMCFEKKTLKEVLKKIEFKRFPNLGIDFRLAVYYSIILNKFYIHKSHLTYYRQVEESMDSKYVKYRSIEWWKRREEAFEFLNFVLKKNKLPINKGLDFFITKLFNNILNI